MSQYDDKDFIEWWIDEIKTWHPEHQKTMSADHGFEHIAYKAWAFQEKLKKEWIKKYAIANNSDTEFRLKFDDLKEEYEVIKEALIDAESVMLKLVPFLKETTGGFDPARNLIARWREENLDLCKRLHEDNDDIT